MHHNPEYPKLNATVAKFRRMGPVSEMTPETRRAYGEAVLSAIRTLNRGHCQRALTPLGNPHCASGTAHTDGAAILKAIKQRIRKALDRAIEDDHKRRKEKDIRREYRHVVAVKKWERRKQVRAEAAKVAEFLALYQQAA